GARADPRSDAERAYLRGLRLSQAGDPDAARRLWQGVVVAFGPAEAESRWVELARAGLEALNRPENRGTRAPPDHAAFDAAPARAKDLDPAGKAAALRALEDLFRDDPALVEKIRQARD